MTCFTSMTTQTVTIPTANWLDVPLPTEMPCASSTPPLQWGPFNGSGSDVTANILLQVDLTQKSTMALRGYNRISLSEMEDFEDLNVWVDKVSSICLMLSAVWHMQPVAYRDKPMLWANSYDTHWLDLPHTQLPHPWLSFNTPLSIGCQPPYWDLRDPLGQPPPRPPHTHTHTLMYATGCSSVLRSCG